MILEKKNPKVIQKPKRREIFPVNSPAGHSKNRAECCVGGEIVKGDEGPVSGVAQVVCHGVKVRVVHREEGQDEEGEKQGEVER